MSEEPTSGEAAGSQDDAQLDALMAAADEQMLAAIKRRLNLDAGLADIFGDHSRNEPSAQQAADSSPASEAEATRQEAAHVTVNPFSASSWKQLWKRLRSKQEQRKPPHQAAAFIEMRLITRSLAGYFAQLTDRAGDLNVDLKRVYEQCLSFLDYAQERRPSLSIVNSTEKALDQVVVDAGRLALDLETPREMASKLAAIARAAKDRNLVQTGTELAAALTRCHESARKTWESLDEARRTAAGLAARMGEGEYILITEIQNLAQTIRDYSMHALHQHGGLAGDLKTTAARNPAEHLESIEIDASGADLSDSHLPDIDLLDLVIWTDETKWPDAMEDEVKAHSTKIKEDVYQVHSGGGRTKPKSVDV